MLKLSHPLIAASKLARTCSTSVDNVDTDDNAAKLSNQDTRWVTTAGTDHGLLNSNCCGDTLGFYFGVGLSMCFTLAVADLVFSY